LKGPGRVSLGLGSSIGSSPRTISQSIDRTQHSMSSTDTAGEPLGLSPATLVSLSHSPAGIGALKEYMSSHGDVKISVSSPNTRQNRTEDENNAEKDDIEKLLELKREAQQRAQHERYLKGLEAQSKLEEEQRRQAVRDARAKRLEAEVAVLSTSMDSKKSYMDEARMLASAPESTTQSAVSSRAASFCNTDTEPNNKADNDSSDEASVDSADLEEAKERARLEEAERKRYEAVSKLPEPIAKKRMSLVGDEDLINAGTLTIDTPEYQKSKATK
jgi:hypothetical protein